MSIYWKYIAPLVTNGRISKIEFMNKLECNPPIHTWKVTMNNNDVHDLIDLEKKIKININHLEEYSLQDKRALLSAIENNKQLNKKYIMEIYSKIF